MISIHQDLICSLFQFVARKIAQQLDDVFREAYELAMVRCIIMEQKLSLNVPNIDLAFASKLLNNVELDAPWAFACIAWDIHIWVHGFGIRALFGSHTCACRQLEV